MRQCKPADHAGAGLLALIRAITAAKSDPEAMTPGVAIVLGWANRLQLPARVVIDPKIYKCNSGSNRERFSATDERDVAENRFKYPSRRRDLKLPALS